MATRTFLYFAAWVACSAYTTQKLTTRNQMPIAQPDDVIEFFYLEKLVYTASDGNDSFTLLLAGLNQHQEIYHGGVGFRFRNRTPKVEFALEYIAVNGLESAIFPTLVNSTLVWKNEGQIMVDSEILQARWQRALLMGTVDGTSFNKYCDFALYEALHPRLYQPFAVINHKTKALYLSDNTCVNFCWDSMRFYAGLGVKFTPAVQPMRSIVGYTASQMPVKVNMEDSVQAEKVIDFYGSQVAVITLFVLPKKSSLDMAYVYIDKNYYLIQLEEPKSDIDYRQDISYMRP